MVRQNQKISYSFKKLPVVIPYKIFFKCTKKPIKAINDEAPRTSLRTIAIRPSR